MSRIGKKLISIPAGVTIQITGLTISVKGPKGELKKQIHPDVKVEVKDNAIHVTRKDDSKESRSLHGMTRSIIANMVEGVTKGYEKIMEIIGVGYRAVPNKNKLSLTLGFSHPVEFEAPTEIEFTMDKEKKNILTIRGIDKQMVGEVAAKVRSFKKPEPYKGKGIKYIDEVIERKAGKAAISAEGGAK